MAATWPQGGGMLPQPPSSFEWEGDEPLHLPMEDLVIYEMHVRGFTRDEASKAQSPGQQLGSCRRRALRYLIANSTLANHISSVANFGIPDLR